MIGERYGKETAFPMNGQAEAGCTELKFFDALCFPELLVQRKVTVLIITDNREADAGKVYAYLVHSAALDADGKETVGFCTGKKPIGTECRLCNAVFYDRCIDYPACRYLRF